MLGAPLGPLRVDEATPQRLRLAPPVGFNTLMIPAALLCLLVGGGRLAAPDLFGRPLAAELSKDWGFIAVCAGVACVFVGLPGFRLAYTIDGPTRTVTKRTAFRTRTWRGHALRGVAVRVGHDGPTEVLVLALEGKGGDEVVAYAAADRGGAVLPLVAARVAELLRLPVTRAGTPVQAGSGVREVLDRVAPPPGGAAALGDGRDLVINCPACKATRVPAVSYDHRERSHGVAHTSTWVKCLACGTHLYSKVSAAHLFGRSPAELERLVVLRLSLVARATAVLAVVLCLFPWVGFGMALLATLVNWRTRGWPRLASRVALAVSVVPTVAITLLVNS